ncbi:MAG TPA: TldD/PmbA family protein [Spirochaetota bacterium]|mgnify:FL=1|nr:TldD/PmbA family protein [Spirochaetota bacterium]HOR45779.1 TldD/PmbA family protein [Spirochaetota bacterium]HPK57451.1 TldD/PmbA family protein [Spirochaetota bacterium]
MISAEKYLKANTDWYEFYFEESESFPISFANNRFYSMSEKFSSGCGIRVSVDGRIGFSFSNNKDKLLETAQTAVSLLKFSEIQQITLPEIPHNIIEPITYVENNISTDLEISSAENTISLITSEFNDALSDVRINSGKGSRRIINSKGLDFSSKYSFYSASVSTERILDDKSRISVWDSVSSIKKENYEHLCSEIIQVHKLSQISAKVNPGKVPVIFTPHAFSSLISILLNQLSGGSHYKKISPFTGKIGEKLFSDNLTITDNPLLDNSYHSFALDDEGVTARQKDIISSGVINEIITDLKYSSLLGIKPSGNSSRSYSSLPSPSFSNVIIKPGTLSLSDLMKTAKNGILVDQMIGLGQSNTITGDFSCNLSLAFSFNENEIQGRIKDCMISGNLYQLLNSEIVFSSETKQTGNFNCPYVLFSSIDLSA